jgi:hypothetical protein
VITGAMNDEAVVIVEGLAEGDEVLLIAPPDAATLELVRLPNSPVGKAVAGGDTATGTAPVTPPARGDSAPPTKRN